MTFFWVASGGGFKGNSVLIWAPCQQLAGSTYSHPGGPPPRRELDHRSPKMNPSLKQASELPPVDFERPCMQFGVPNDPEIGLSWVCRANVKMVLSLQRELKWQVFAFSKTGLQNNPKE